MALANTKTETMKSATHVLRVTTQQFSSHPRHLTAMVIMQDQTIILKCMFLVFHSKIASRDLPLVPFAIILIKMIILLRCAKYSEQREKKRETITKSLDRVGVVLCGLVSFGCVQVDVHYNFHMRSPPHITQFIRNDFFINNSQMEWESYSKSLNWLLLFITQPAVWLGDSIGKSQLITLVHESLWNNK